MPCDQRVDQVDADKQTRLFQATRQIDIIAAGLSVSEGWLCAKSRLWALDRMANLRPRAGAEGGRDGADRDDMGADRSVARIQRDRYGRRIAVMEQVSSARMACCAS